MARMLLLAVALVVPLPSAAVVLRVPADHGTIQGAILAAADGDTVLVAPGVYFETLDFLGKAVTVTSEAGPEATIVDARRLGPAALFRSGEGPRSVLSGFTLRNGLTGDTGGCVAISSGAPTIAWNHVLGCESTYGGGGIGVSFSSASIRGNVVAGCRARGLGGGGVLVIGAGSAEIVGNLIAENDGGNGGGIELWAAGTPLIAGNVLRGNRTDGVGGGIVAYNGSDADVIQNAIVENSARTGGGVAFLVPSGARGPLLVANTIVGNNATAGSALYASGFPASMLVVNDVLASPDATEAVLCDFTRSNVGPTFDHVLAHAAGGEAYEVCPDPTGTSGNVSAAPLLADPASGDFRLAPGSPGVDAGLSTAPMLPDLDLDGGPRISGAAVDIGAWELPGPGLSMTPARVEFGTVPVGETPSATVTIANGGVATLDVAGAVVSPSFAIAGGTCGGALAPGASCTIVVSFQPSGLGRHHGVLTPAIDGARVPFPALLAGTAGTLDLAFSPASLDLGSAFVGEESSPAVVTVSNPNAVAVAIDAFAITGYHATDFAQTTDCPASLAPGASCTAAVTCAPTGVGSRVAALVPTGAFVVSQGVPLACEGMEPIVPSASLLPPTLTTSAGWPATYSLLLGRSGWLAEPLEFTCATDAPASSCDVEPASLGAAIGGATALVTVRTTAGGGILGAAPVRGGAGGAQLALSLLAIGAAPLARRRARAVVIALAVAALSCIRSGDADVTRPGTYEVAVTVASATGSQTVHATLVVSE